MRNWLNLFENARTKEATRTEFDIPFADETGMGDLVPHREQNSKVVPGSIAPKSRTRVNKSLDGDSARMLGDLASSGLRDTVDIGDTDVTDGVEPVQPPVENLPAVIGQAVMGGGRSGPSDPQAFNPEWHQVKNLPGYMQNPIRAMGRMVFAPFTDTPIEDIQVLATLTNPESDVKKMMAWIKANGVKDDSATLRFTEIMPGYNADVSIWNTEGYQFILVRDQMGHYVYGMNGGRGSRLDAPQQMARLEGLDEDTRSNLRGLSELNSGLETEYRRFMEGDFINDKVPAMLRGNIKDAQGNEFDEHGKPIEADAAAPTGAAPTGAQPSPATASGSGQSNSTVKPGAGGAPQQQGNAAAPAKTAGPAPMLNANQQQARDRADAAKAAANTPK